MSQATLGREYLNKKTGVSPRLARCQIGCSQSVPQPQASESAGFPASRRVILAGTLLGTGTVAAKSLDPVAVRKKLWPEIVADYFPLTA